MAHNVFALSTLQHGLTRKQKHNFVINPKYLVIIKYSMPLAFKKHQKAKRKQTVNYSDALMNR